MHIPAGNLDRRTILRLVTALASGYMLPVQAQVKLPGPPFTLGVASGSPTPSGAVIWTRLRPSGWFSSLENKDIPVRWEVAQDDQFTSGLQQGTVTASAALAHSVHVELEGLKPDQWYFYRFHAGEYTSPVGRTRTLPTPDAVTKSLRLAYASCQRWEHGYFGAYKHLVADQPDLVLFLGDYIYEYPGATRSVRNTGSGWVQSLEDYRNRYALYKEDADLQSAHATCPWLYTWDDHEVHNDYAGDTAGFTSSSEAYNPTQFPGRRAAAYQAWYEHTPVRAHVLTRSLSGLAEGAEMRIYQTLQWGRLAQLTMLDPRQYRSRQVCTQSGRLGSSIVESNACQSLRDPNRSLLGAAQEAWLSQQMATTGFPWQVLGQGSLLGPRNFRTGNSPETNPAIWNDGWDGYPMARDRLTATLAKAREMQPTMTPVVLGGDVHENWVGQIKALYSDANSQNVGAEFCGTSITSRSTPTASDVMEARLATNAHFKFADNVRKGYGLCEFTPTRLTTQLRVVDNVERRSPEISTLATFEVKAGQVAMNRI